MSNEDKKFKKIILKTIMIFMLLTLILLCLVIKKKNDLTLEFLRVSQYPTGSICIGALGKPLQELDGEKDFEWYKNFTNLRDQKFLVGKKIYLWQAPMFHYIIVVVDKSNDQVCFVTYHPM